MAELAIWIVSLIIVIWTILTIGIPLLLVGTAIVISAKRIISGFIGLLFVFVAVSTYESNSQFSVGAGAIGIALVIWAFGKDEKQIKSEIRTVRYDSHQVALDSKNNDEMYNEAVEIVRASGKASASLLQKSLRVGYARAARLVEEMETNGIIGRANGAEPREVLIK
ncbi:MAG: cell division FtsK/SpoIIIE [Candidatus Saccharibacteria bacterium]|nr:cell division FtsK/SpoIIIE [Candidatus Saccharibacteria bacterium]